METTPKLLYTLRKGNHKITFTENLSLSSDGWFITVERSNRLRKDSATSGHITQKNLQSWVDKYTREGYQIQ